MMCLAVLIAAASALPAPADSGARPITMEETVALAQRNAVAVIQAEGQRRNGVAGLRSAYGAFLPSVSLSAGANRQIPIQAGQTRVVGGQVVTYASAPWSYSGSVGASVDLFSGGRRFFDLQQARAQSSAADANLVAQRYGAVLAAQQQFFNVLATRESEAAAGAQLEQAQQQLRVSVLRLRLRAVTRSDSLRSEIQVHNAQLAVVQARTTLAVANATLTRSVGTPYPVTAAEDSSIDRPGLSLDDEALRKLALEGPAVRQASASLDAAHAAARIAWSAYLPAVTASYSRGGNGTGNTFAISGDDLSSYSGALRLSLSLPLFTQFQNEAKVTQAQVSEDNAVATLRDAKLAALEGLTQSLGSFHAAEERIGTQNATVEAAIEDLREQQQKYAIGAATLLDVLTSQTTLDQARHDLIQARYDRRVARAQLEALVGRSL